MKTISSLTVMDSVKLISLLRQVAKKFYLKKTSCLHLSHEEFMSDMWSDRARIEYHGLSIVLERWSWNGKDEFDFVIYYKGVEINPFQWGELIEYINVILWYLSESAFRDICHCSLFKDEIAQKLELRDEIRKFEKKSNKIHHELMEILTKAR